MSLAKSITEVEHDLIIDDNAKFIYGIKRHITEVSFCEKIIEYQNGQEALNGLKAITDNREPLPSVIFADLNMPVKN